MQYNKYTYFYPPRPKNAIPTKDIVRWDNNSMLAQPKMNGSNCVIFTDGRDFRIMGRHKQNLSNFRLSKVELLELSKPLDRGKWLVINGEYLNKSKSDENGQVFNHKFIVFDLLVVNSEHLIGSTFSDRVNLIGDMYGSNECDKDYLYQYTDNIYRVKSYYNNFKEEFDRLTKIDMVEGLVMKRKNAKLELGLREDNNSRSQIKSRKETKNYRF